MHKVLLVDDSEDEVFFFKRAHKRTGRTDLVHVVGSGAEAIAYLDAVGLEGMPSLVIIDLEMPRIDGFQVLEWIRKHSIFFGLPVVMMTNSSEREDVLRACGLGANSYVVKPCDPSELASILAVLLQYWCEIHQSPLFKAYS